MVQNNYNKCIVVSFLVLLTFFITSCDENNEICFNNYDAIQKHSYILKGWIPEFIPKDCSKIQVVNNIDNNHFYGVFSFTSNSFINDSTFSLINLNAIMENLNQIHNSNYPDWFINKQELKLNNKLAFYKVEKIYIIVNTDRKKCYYFG